MKPGLITTAIVFSAILIVGSASVRAEEVWFSPNVASLDYLDLFNSPEQWAIARSSTT